jgi:hypothetical protein
MEGRAFDRLTRIISQTASRRRGVRAALATLLSLGGGQALARPHGQRTLHRERVHAEACIPTGKPCPSKKPRGHNKRGKARTLSCHRCCQGHVAVVDGVTVCACQPDTMSCTKDTECCAGVCANGSCVASVSSPLPPPSPPPPPPPCTGLPLGATCTESSPPCCSNNPNAFCGGGANHGVEICQDCSLPPSAAGAYCQTPLGHQCCGGNPNCFIGVRVQDGAPVCLSIARCNSATLGACSQDSDCPRPGQPPSATICIRNDTPGGSAGCCDSGVTTLCGAPCGSGV